MSQHGTIEETEEPWKRCFLCGYCWNFINTSEIRYTAKSIPLFSVRRNFIGKLARKRLEEGNCNNVPKRTKLNAERQREYREIHKNLYVEYMRNYRQRKAQEIKFLGNGNLILFPGYVLYIPYLEEGQISFI
jgi:hypothetical protein